MLRELVRKADVWGARVTILGRGAAREGVRAGWVGGAVRCRCLSLASVSGGLFIESLTSLSLCFAKSRVTAGEATSNIVELGREGSTSPGKDGDFV